MSWDQLFFDPIMLPGQKPLATLRDAALYIIELPKADHDANEWKAAMQALLLVAEQGRACDVRSPRRHETVEPSHRTVAQMLRTKTHIGASAS